MNNDPNIIKVAVGEVIAFLRGKKADANLVLQDSQKMALYQIRDLLIKPERELIEIKHYGCYGIRTSDPTSSKLLVTPPKSFSICITNLIISTNVEIEVRIGPPVDPIPLFTAVLYLAERGGIAMHFGKDTPYIVPNNKELYLWWFPRTGDASDRLTVDMNYYFKRIKLPD